MHPQEPQEQIETDALQSALVERVPLNGGRLAFVVSRIAIVWLCMYPTAICMYLCSSYVCGRKYIVMIRCKLNSSARIGSIKMLKAEIAGSPSHFRAFLF